MLTKAYWPIGQLSQEMGAIIAYAYQQKQEAEVGTGLFSIWCHPRNGHRQAVFNLNQSMVAINSNQVSYFSRQCVHR